MSRSTSERDGLLLLLGIPDFRRLWIGQSVSDVGDNLTLVSLLFLVQRLAGSPAALAGLAVTMLLPSSSSVSSPASSSIASIAVW